MKKLVLTSATIILIMVNQYLNAQQIPVISDRTTPTIEPLRLDGPRMGVVFSPVANYEMLYEISNFYGEDNKVPELLSTIGWQFEWRYFAGPDGSAGLLELIPMFTGLDAGLVIPTVNVVTGYRTASGFEFGLGPNINPFGTGMVFAVGHNFHTDYVNFPINMAFIRGRETLRVALTVGFNIRSKERQQVRQF
jgi:hypothetical protein